MKGLLKNELVRMLFSPRWWLVAPAALIPAHLYGVNTVEWLNQEGANMNAWDGVIITFSAGDTWTLGLFFLPTFVFIAGDRFVVDKLSGYLSWLSLRILDRRKLWTSKIIAICLVALIYSTLFLTLVAIYSHLMLPSSGDWGQLIQTPAKADSFPVSSEAKAFYKTVSPFSVMVLSAIFMGVGLGAITSLLVFLTMKIRKAYIPLVAAIILGLSSNAIFGPLGTLGLSPVARLNFDYHVGIGLVTPRMFFHQTLIIWIVIYIIVIYFGQRILKHMELF